MLWFIKLLENTSIYQLWESTDCSGAVQTASLASEMSQGVAGEIEGKEKMMATGGKWECKELVVSDASAFVFCWALAALLPTAFLGLCARPLTFDFSIHIFGPHTVFLRICICFSVVRKYALCSLCWRAWSCANSQEECEGTDHRTYCGHCHGPNRIMLKVPITGK